MTWVESARRPTGMVIGEAGGAAVSAATRAGERIWRAATQPASASPTTTARSTIAVRRWTRDIIYHRRPSHRLAAAGVSVRPDPASWSSLHPSGKPAGRMYGGSRRQVNHRTGCAYNARTLTAEPPVNGSPQTARPPGAQDARRSLARRSAHRP